VRVYTVHAPADDLAGDTDEALAAYTDRFVFVPERFSLLAALFSLPWLLLHRLWLATLGFIALVIAVNVAGQAVGLSREVMPFLSLGISVILGFEAHNLRRLSLERSGYRLLGVVSASNLSEAEHKFFDQWLRERAATPDRRDRNTSVDSFAVDAAAP